MTGPFFSAALTVYLMVSATANAGETYTIYENVSSHNWPMEKQRIVFDEANHGIWFTESDGGVAYHPIAVDGAKVIMAPLWSIVLPRKFNFKQKTISNLNVVNEGKVVVDIFGIRHELQSIRVKKLRLLFDQKHGLVAIVGMWVPHGTRFTYLLVGDEGLKP